MNLDVENAIKIFLNPLVTFTQFVLTIDKEFSFIGVDPNALGIELNNTNNVLIPDIPKKLLQLACLQAEKKFEHKGFLEYEIRI